MTLSRPRRTLDAGGGSDDGRSGTGAISGSCLGLGFHRNSIKGTVGRLWEHEELLRRPGMWESPGIVPADPAMLCLYPFDEHQSYFGLHQEQAPLFPHSLPTLRRKFCKAKTSLRVKPASGSEVQGSRAGLSDNAGLSRRLHERRSVCLGGRSEASVRDAFSLAAPLSSRLSLIHRRVVGCFGPGVGVRRRKRNLDGGR